MNRKKISLKGVLLALAVSVPSLISTVAFTATNQSNNQSHLLFDNKTSSSLPELYNQDLSINPMLNVPSVDISLNYAYSLSFVDSTSDRNYPHANDSIYINSNHYPKRNALEYSPTITFAEINVKEMFNLDTVKDFFTLYNLSFTYTYRLNIWSSSSGWNHPGGKYILDSIDKVTWNANDSTFTGRKTELGHLDSGRKAYAKIQVFMTYSSTVIKIQGFAVSAFNWANGSLIHHAAYALLGANTLKAELKLS